MTVAHPLHTSASVSIEPSRSDGIRSSARTSERSTLPLAATDAADVLTPTRPGVPPVSAMLVAGDTVGRYMVVSRLGAGGMGVVFEAHDPELDRRVALKVLHGAKEPAQEARILREAEALARLSHPNVVQVYEVGRSRAGTFIAMEMVEGTTLRQWQRAEPRSLEQVLSMYCAAGEGLVAAHRAGLVHRDFKPENVQIGADGRPRVLDFGLARAERSQDALPASRTLPSMRVADWLAHSLTRAGAVVGTLAYMSPEQHRGGRVDEASDQFSFCVSLYEALYGRHPFAAESPLMIAVATIEGRLQPVPRGSKVPRWLRRILIKGLAPEPAARHDSINALLRALAAGLERSPPRRFTLAGTAILVAALGLSGATSDPVDCESALRQLTGIWDDSRRAEIRDAMHATKLGFADDTALRVSTRLDAYAQSWVDAKRSVCRANREADDAVVALLDLQTVCLEDRLTSLHSLVDQLTLADREVTARALPALESLESIERCSDIDVLRATYETPPPEIAQDIEATEAILHQAMALHRVGRRDEARARAVQAVERARAVDYPPIVATSLVGLASVLDDSDDEEARGLLMEAYFLATGVGRHDTAFRAAEGVIETAAASQSGFELAAQWHRIAEAAIDRQPSPDDGVRASLDQSMGTFLSGFNHWEAAIPHLQASIDAQLRRAHVSRHELREASFSLGISLSRLERFDEAADVLEGLLVDAEADLGADHPEVGHYLSAIAISDAQAGELERAYQRMARARSISERTYGPESAKVGQLEMNLGALADVQRRTSVARQHATRAVEILSSRPDDPLLAKALGNLASAYYNEKRDLEGLPFARRAYVLTERAKGPDHLDTVNALETLSNFLLPLGYEEEAEIGTMRVLEVRERELPPGHSLISMSLENAANMFNRMHRYKRAVELYERALQMRLEADYLDSALPQTRFRMAKALWATGRQRRRAHRLARQALDGLLEGQTGPRRGMQAGPAQSIEKIEAWLETHPAHG